MPERSLRVFFTGASSFTGYWFAKTLAEAGHEVLCPFTREGENDYSGMRKRRVEALVSLPGIRPLWALRLSGETVDRVANIAGCCDVFCHHAAEVGDYKNPEFDPLSCALKSVAGVPELIVRFARTGCRRFVQTGTYFESDEGVEGAGSPAFSPYAVSKTLASEITRFHANKADMAYTKFVMPNPFGPMEDRGFTWYLAGEWLAGRTAAVRTPDYLRDNMPVTVMAKEYAAVVASTWLPGTFRRVRPSGFSGRQGDFAKTFASALKDSGFPGDCSLEIVHQVSFDEPLIRMNSGEGHRPGWTVPVEADFWKFLADFYWVNRPHFA